MNKATNCHWSALITAIAFVLCVAPSVRAETIGTLAIISLSAEAAPTCARYSPIGVCLWLHCSLFECDVRTSVKVGHYQPDAVVSVYNDLGANPWREARSVLASAQRRAAEGVLGRLMHLGPEQRGQSYRRYVGSRPSESDLSRGGRDRPSDDAADAVVVEHRLRLRVSKPVPAFRIFSPPSMRAPGVDRYRKSSIWPA